MIYDLEKRVRLTNLSELSPDKINENYFGKDLSDVEEAKVELKEFEQLIKKYRNDDLSEEEEIRVAELEVKLNKLIPYLLSDEHLIKFRESQKYLYE